MQNLIPQYLADGFTVTSQTQDVNDTKEAAQRGEGDLDHRGSPVPVHRPGHRLLLLCIQEF
jgi:hypothetical protein